MKFKILFIFLLIPFFSYSQRKVVGKIIDKYGEFVIGAIIQEIGTNNLATADFNGQFTINTLTDTCSIKISFVSFVSKTYKIRKDTMINVILPIWDYRTTWFTIGTNYEIINSNLGFSFSNGLDEQPLIDFESFSSDLIYKISGQTNFKNNFSYNGQLAWKYPIRGIYKTSIEYSKTKLTTINFNCQNISFTNEFVHTGLITKLEYQKLSDKNNFGINLGLENVIYKTYLGFIVGYYFGYFNYKLFIQRFLYKQFISFRFDYERIDSFDFANIGIHFSISKTKLIE